MTSRIDWLAAHARAQVATWRARVDIAPSGGHPVINPIMGNNSAAVALRRRCRPRPAAASADLPAAAEPVVATVVVTAAARKPAKRRVRRRASNLKGVAGTTFNAVLKSSCPPVAADKVQAAITVGSDCTGLGSEGWP